MKVEELDLTGDALIVAIEVAARFPQAVFTRGRTTRAGQARAMAQNIAKSSDGVMWLRKTYRATDSLEKVIATVEAITHPYREPAVEIALAALFAGFNASELAQITKHPAGEAFDIQPVDAPWVNDMCVYLTQRAVDLGGKFFEHEGDLRRLHWQAR